jgi:hypothetical protein
MAEHRSHRANGLLLVLLAVIVLLVTAVLDLYAGLYSVSDVGGLIFVVLLLYGLMELSRR